jgi:hypothetical protein
MLGDIFVTGLVVPDLERAIAETTRSLGAEFTPVQESPLQLRTPKATCRQRWLMRAHESILAPPRR